MAVRAVAAAERCCCTVLELQPRRRVLCAGNLDCAGLARRCELRDKSRSFAREDALRENSLKQYSHGLRPGQLAPTKRRSSFARRTAEGGCPHKGLFQTFNPSRWRCNLRFAASPCTIVTGVSVGPLETVSCGCFRASKHLYEQEVAPTSPQAGRGVEPDFVEDAAQ